MNRLRLLLPYSVVLATAGLVMSSALAAAPLAAQLPASTRVQVAAITWVVDSVVLKLRPAPAAVCLSSSTPRRLNGHQAPMRPGVDLDPATINDIPRSPIPFRPGSACSSGTTSPRPVLETSTRRQAVAVTVGPAQLQGRARATVEVSFTVNGRWGGGYHCAAARTRDVWTITSCTMTWIS